MVRASCSVSLRDVKALPTILVCKPSTAATTLPAATMDGGLAMNLTSEEYHNTITRKFVIVEMNIKKKTTIQKQDQKPEEDFS